MLNSGPHCVYWFYAKRVCGENGYCRELLKEILLCDLPTYFLLIKTVPLNTNVWIHFAKQVHATGTNFAVFKWTFYDTKT